MLRYAPLCFFTPRYASLSRVPRLSDGKAGSIYRWVSSDLDSGEAPRDCPVVQSGEIANFFTFLLEELSMARKFFCNKKHLFSSEKQFDLPPRSR